MTLMKKCNVCAGTRLQQGVLSAGTHSMFVPDGVHSFWGETGVPVTAIACTSCGAVALVADMDKLGEALKNKN